MIMSSFALTWFLNMVLCYGVNLSIVLANKFLDEDDKIEIRLTLVISAITSLCAGVATVILGFAIVLFLILSFVLYVPRLNEISSIMKRINDKFEVR